MLEGVGLGPMPLQQRTGFVVLLLIYSERSSVGIDGRPMENVRGGAALAIPASRLLRVGGAVQERPTRIPPPGSTPGYGTILSPNRLAKGGNRGGATNRNGLNHRFSID